MSDSVVEKLAVLLLIVTGVTLAAVSVSSQSANAQQVTGLPVNFTKFFSENKEFQNCFNGYCTNQIDVLYADPFTVALASGFVEPIWKAVAEVKKSGYKIDGVTSYPVSSGTSLKQNILVVMSK